MIQRKTLRARQGGFTLLELTIVLAILAAVAGTVVTQYEGLIDKAGVGTSTFNDSALASAISTFRVVNQVYPDDWDALVDTTGAPYVGLSQELTKNGTDQGTAKLLQTTLTANQVTALNNVGITSLQYIVPTFNVAVGAIPNADFINMNLAQNPGATPTTWTGPRGQTAQFAAGSFAYKVDPVYLQRIAPQFSGNKTSGDIVLAFGVGSSATIVKNGLADAPYYAKAAPNEYGRFLALFLVTRDVPGTNGGAAPTVPPQVIPPTSGTDSIPSGALTYANFYADLPKAQFLGILDGHGDGQDEEYAEYNGQKPN